MQLCRRRVGLVGRLILEGEHLCVFSKPHRDYEKEAPTTNYPIRELFLRLLCESVRVVKYVRENVRKLVIKSSL